MNRLMLAVVVTAFLGACGSSVKLDDKVPVDDKSGTPVYPNGSDGRTGSSGQSSVAAVDIGKSTPSSVAQSADRIVYFDFDSAAIRPEFQPLIESHARGIKADKNKRVAIEGHTDERGGREYNLSLGQRRAESVRRAMALLGVPESQMEAVSFGKEKPAELGSTEAAMEKNRRAEITYR
ncbi:MAG: peptidoglycan-associated lipoprotein Pal [Rhodoferax sp.]|nr:peptidoglycan-associated lipoprotein Pal [Rhodoferax sp.]